MNHFLKSSRCNSGFTLIEALISTLLAGILTAGLITSFVQSHRTSEWSSYSLAAQAIAMQSIEQARGVKWDPYAYPIVDELVPTNFPDRVEILDVPTSGNNIVYATNRVTIRTISAMPPLKQIKVQCTWTFFDLRVFTNTIMTYRAADQ
jgi:type II secretory pathway pseudopilin PulG